jgi:two-component system phosphate regulon sensor histidine kinase PhoR
LVERARTDGQALGLELEVEFGGQPARLLQVNASTFDDGEGRARGVILVFHDLTRLKELEGTRRDFVANVSHELRTPLALIKGFVETLIDGARNDPEVALRFLRTIEKHTNRLTFLIEDLLTISQLEAGQVAMSRRRGVLRPLVARVLEDFGARAGARSISLVNEVPASLELRADPDRFYRVDAARSREQGGTGLGLSIVKHIVQAHGGEVRAESDPGKGTTFRLTLPDDAGT